MERILAISQNDSDFRELFVSLAGSWTLERTITGDASFNGSAEFEQLGKSEFRLREKGHLAMADGREIAASRNWIWRLEETGNLHVLYDENPLRTYHDIELVKEGDVWTGEATHLCEPDTYLGHYELEFNRIVVKQKIEGPNKNYALTSLFNRILN